MTASESRRGSALLIVLGMVAFMVVSAVGFSVFMRQNRAPSGYLRRSTSSRHLCRAALSAAMSEIDYCLANDAHLQALDTHDPSFRTSPNYPHNNAWFGRVLFPNYEGGKLNSMHPLNGSAKTFVALASPLTLEALAHLPPPFVNDVRYFSRYTSTAAWSKLDFDAGRVSYIVVDISDCFDLGRVLSGKPRGSGDDSLVTTTYLFQDGQFQTLEADPVAFQDFIDQLSASTEGPLVSLADYNVALHKLGGGTGVSSPFCKYVERGGDSFYQLGPGGNSWQGSDAYRRVMMQLFSTFGHSELTHEEWFDQDSGNGGAAAADVFDISKSENQPFPTLMSGGDSESRNDMSAEQAGYQENNAFRQRYVSDINPAEAIALYDYLDADSVPTSVAVPTAERAPMIAGVYRSPDDTLKMKITAPAGEEIDWKPEVKVSDTQKTQFMRHRFNVQLDGTVKAGVGFAFPFKWHREHNEKVGRYNARGVAAIYLLPYADRWTEGGGGKNGCRMDPQGKLSKDFKDVIRQKSASMSANFREGGYILVGSDSRDTSLPREIVDTPEKAVSASSGQFSDVELCFDPASAANKLADEQNCLITYYLKRTKTYNPSTGGWTEGAWEIDDTENGGKPKPGGFLAMDFDSGEGKPVQAGSEYILGVSMAVTLRDDAGNLIDCAPAHPDDDDVAPSGEFAGAYCGCGRPVLRFDARDMTKIKVGNTIDDYKDIVKQVNQVSDAPLAPSMWLVDDPRYNYAAEDWFPLLSEPNANSVGKAWLASQGSSGNGRDGDTFMNVSNRGYLQDPCELAFIPRVTGFNNTSEIRPITDAATGRIPASRDDCANRDIMWRTYGCFGDKGEDEVDRLRMSAGPVNGFRANPYAKDDTDDKLIWLAPFINTPYDWWAASTNYEHDVVKETISVDPDGYAQGKGALENALKYTFGPAGVETAVDADKMKELAAVVFAELADTKDKGNWYKRWLEMNWMSQNGSDRLLGVDMGVKLHSVDRKFLCSYWRKCFANQQQVFLVFFRAEPVILGGGTTSTAGSSAGVQTSPAQLGVRAVAAIWRDPRRTGITDDFAPNPMRVLFYHQFE